MRKWVYIKYYKPRYKLVCGTVEIYYCFRLTKVKIVGGSLFVPIRYYRSDTSESFSILSNYIREIKAKSIQRSYKERNK